MDCAAPASLAPDKLEVGAVQTVFSALGTQALLAVALGIKLALGLEPVKALLLFPRRVLYCNAACLVTNSTLICWLFTISFTNTQSRFSASCF